MPRGSGYHYRDTKGRFAKAITARIEEELEAKAKALDANLKQDVSEEMLRCIRTNVANSYSPRSTGENAETNIQEKKDYNEKAETWNKQARETQALTGKRQRMMSPTYQHVGILEDSFYVVVDGNKLILDIRKDAQYINIATSETRSAKQIYEWLKEGTKGNMQKPYPYAKSNKKDAKFYWAYNYPTPPHDFEDKTRRELTDYLLKIKTQVKNKTYKNASGYSIKKGRR